MTLSGHIFQFEIQVRVKSPTFSFGGLSFKAFARKRTNELKISLVVAQNNTKSPGLISSVSVALSSPCSKYKQYCGLALRRENDVVSLYSWTITIAPELYTGVDNLRFNVHLEPAVLASLRWPSQSLALWEAALEKQFTDVVFRVEGEEFAAHKAVLCISSPVFAAMFSNQMKEAQTGVVNITDITAAIFEEFLRFLYTGYVKDSQTLESVYKELGAVADKYDVPALKILCSVNAVNCSEVFDALTGLLFELDF